VKRAVLVCLVAVISALVPSHASAQTTSNNNKKFQPRFEVIPQLIDNQASVASTWLGGTGCPDANPTFTCPNTFEKDPANQGLLMSKVDDTLPGKAVAIIKGVKGTFITELGYDLRKAEQQFSNKGSECNGISPRFELQTANMQNYFIPCQLPNDNAVSGLYWQRLRWGAACPGTPATNPTCVNPVPIVCADQTNGCGLALRVQTLRIVHDVGPQDENVDTAASMEEFGLAVLDNIDVNGRLKGTGPGPRHGDEDEGQGRDKDGREFYHSDSASVPQDSVFEFHDPLANVNLASVGGVTGIAYSVGPLGQPCVSFNGNATNNGNPGYVYSWVSCDLSAVGSDLGTYSITVTGPVGTLPYNQTGALTMGNVTIHPH